MTKTKLTLTLFFLFSFTLLGQEILTTTSLQDSVLVDSSSVNLSDSLKARVKGDTLRPLYYHGYLEDDPFNNRMTKEQIDKFDYRLISDLFNNLSFGYHADLGAVGTPGQVFLYGLGFNNISYLENGVEITNRYQNSLDLNLYQTENADIIEVPSFASGFIYNSRNNPVTVNLISKNKVAARPYSRIRFYQAPDNEGAFDGRFSAYLFRRVNISFGISNQGADSRYLNSELSNWQFNTNIRYMPSNSLNLIAGYSFADLNTGLNGGVNIYSTPDLIYNNLEADVNFLDRYHKTTRHNFSLSTIFEVDSISSTTLSFYYQYNIDEYRQNEFTTDSTETRIVNDNSYKSFGVNLFQRFQLAFLRLDVIGNFERTDFTLPFSTVQELSSWSLGGKLSWTFRDGLIVPSIFAKTSGIEDNSNSGIGGEIKIRPTDWLTLRAGASTFTRSTNRFLDSLNKSYESDVNIVELGAGIITSNLNLELSYFSIEESNYQHPVISDNIDTYYISGINKFRYQKFTRNGINLNFDLRLWKILLSANSTLYTNEARINSYSIPGFTSFGGIYYVDTLFDSNLDLKAGVNYKFYGNRGYSVYDFQKLISAYSYDYGYPIPGTEAINYIENSYQFDLFVAGTIRERATVYLVFENITASEYFVVPYYPVYPQGFRFGVAWEFLD